MVLVSPYFISNVAVRFTFNFFAILSNCPEIPLLCKAYTIAFNQALSYAFVTSRKVINTGFFLLSLGLNVGVDYFQVVRCGRAFFPPPWHSDMLIFPRILLCIIFSNKFLRLHAAQSNAPLIATQSFLSLPLVYPDYFALSPFLRYFFGSIYVVENTKNIFSHLLSRFY